MTVKNMQLFVVACWKRPAAILPFLEKDKIHHEVHWTTDYDLPDDWKPADQYASYIRHRKGQIGALRCFRGHQDALKKMSPHADAAMILEDDAIPNHPVWTDAIAAAMPLLDKFEIVSLHGRAYHPDAFNQLMPIEFSVKDGSNKATLQVFEPKVQQKNVWVQGSLAYIIRRDAVKRFLAKEYNGLPVDIFICNFFDFALVDPSPFNHGSQGSVQSLID